MRDVRNELESHDQIYAQTVFHFLPESQGQKQDVAIILLRFCWSGIVVHSESLTFFGQKDKNGGQQKDGNRDRQS